MDNLMGILMLCALVLVGGLLYFIPTIIATQRHHHNAASVFVLNLFLGWTLIGWAIALALAVSAVKTVKDG